MKMKISKIRFLIAGLTLFFFSFTGLTCVMQQPEYEVNVVTYSDYPIYKIEYKDENAFEWTEAEMTDGYGNTISYIMRDDSGFSNTAYISVPAEGTYDFSGIDDLGFEVFYIEDCEILYTSEQVMYYLEVDDWGTYFGEISY